MPRTMIEPDEATVARTADVSEEARTALPPSDLQADAQAGQVAGEEAKEPVTAGSQGGPEAKKPPRALQVARGWVSRTFPGHENAFYGGACGLVVALLVFAIGVGRTLFVALLVLAGVAAGQVVDGDPKIVRAIRRLIESQSNR